MSDPAGRTKSAGEAEQKNEGKRLNSKFVDVSLSDAVVGSVPYAWLARPLRACKSSFKPIAALLLAVSCLSTIGNAVATGANTSRTVNSAGGTNASNGIKWLLGSNSQFQAYVSNAGQLFGPNGIPTGTKCTDSGQSCSSNRLFNSVALRIDGGSNGSTRVYYDADNSNQQYQRSYRFIQSSQSTVSGAGTAASPWEVTTRLTGSGAVVSEDANITITIVDRYVSPQAWLTRKVTITGLPTSASTKVKFYQYLDTYLNGSDTGPGFSRNTSSVSSSVPTMVGVNGTTNFEAIAFDESSGTPLWDRYFSGYFRSPLVSICNPNGNQGSNNNSCQTGGGDLTNEIIAAANTDNGLAVQWDIPVSGRNSFTVQYRVAFGTESADIDKQFSPSTILRGGTSTLIFTLNNHTTSSVTGASFTDTLPAGVVIAPVPNIRTSCPGGGTLTSTMPSPMSVTAVAGSNSIAVTGAHINAAPANDMRSCVVSVDVTSSVVGSHANAAANISNLNGLLNLVGDRVLTVNDPPSFGSCDSRMFLSVAGGNTTALSTLNRAVNPLSLNAVGTASLPYDALAYLSSDNYLYAIRSTSGNSNELLKIGSDGQASNLGAVTGLPAGSAIYRAGAANGSGEYYVKAAGANNLMYRINLGSLSAIAITLSANLDVLDMAFVGSTLYAVASNGGLYSIGTTGTLTALGAAASPTSFSALYGSPSGLFGLADTGGLYQFNLATGVRTKIADASAVTLADGANCPTAALSFPADLAITKTDGSATFTPGGNVVYTIVASNAGMFSAHGATVTDALPNGIASATWTCVGSGGGMCTASGSGMISDAAVNLPVGANVTYTLVMPVPADRLTDLVNTATIAAGAATTDSNAANNSATDTDVAAAAQLSISKSNGVDQVARGTLTTYTIVVSNAGPMAANGAMVTDQWAAGAGLDCSSAAGGSLTCPATTGSASCPGTLTPAALASGVQIPQFPANSSVTLQLTCKVL